MAQAITEEEEALRVARQMEAATGNVRPWRENPAGGHSFKYESAVHAHMLEDGWELVGFGSNWFRIRKTL